MLRGTFEVLASEYFSIQKITYTFVIYNASGILVTLVLSAALTGVSDQRVVPVESEGAVPAAPVGGVLQLVERIVR